MMAGSLRKTLLLLMAFTSLSPVPGRRLERKMRSKAYS